MSWTLTSIVVMNYESIYFSVYSFSMFARFDCILFLPSMLRVVPVMKEFVQKSYISQKNAVELKQELLEFCRERTLGYEVAWSGPLVLTVVRILCMFCDWKFDQNRKST